MLAHLKMAIKSDRGPWSSQPSRCSDFSRTFYDKLQLDSPSETPGESRTVCNTVDRVDRVQEEEKPESEATAPLCLVVKKKNILQTPPESPPESHFYSSSSREPSPTEMEYNWPMLNASSSSSNAINQQHEQVPNFHNFSELFPVMTTPDLMASPLFARALATGLPKRTRGEKKPTPEEQKDSKYFERRMRNNLAAKKSRDGRKMREEQIAVRASSLEQENAILKAQLLTLREEAESLRHLLLQKKKSNQLAYR